MTQQKPETVQIGHGSSSFSVGVMTEVVAIANEQRTRTFVSHILGSDKQRYVRVAHRLMEFNCRDGYERGPNGSGRLELYSAARETKIAAEKAEKALRESLVQDLGNIPWHKVVSEQRWLAERILQIANAVVRGNHVPYRLVEDEEPDMSR